jgi:hypothetical protein
MDCKGKQCVIKAWDTRGADIKAPFDVSAVTAAFQSDLKKRLVKKGLSVAETGSDTQIVVHGNFVRIDAGKRWMRYLLTFFAGEAVVELEGELIINGNIAADLHAKSKQYGGILGGGDRELLVLCAKSCALIVSKQVLAGLKKSW